MATNMSPTIPAPPPATLPNACIASSCATKTEHLHIFDAENSTFSANGRLFVSGGSDVYEISKDVLGNLSSTIVSSETCNFTGTTIVGSVLYATCGDNRLFAGDINFLPITPRYTISGSQLANGLAAHNGFLYVTDGPLSFPSKIIQLQIDPSDAFSIIGQADWTSFGELLSANGLQVVNGELWVTNFDQVLRYVINPDNTKGSSSTVLSNTGSALDDFFVLADGRIVVNDNSGNTAFIFDQLGNMLESTTDVLGPSSAIQGQPPMFDAADIIITEKGTLGDNTVGNGNRLAIFRAN